MPRVDLSAMYRFSYDEATRELAVTFKSGKTYKYLDVPKGVYEQFVNARSHGRFFNEHIKDEYAFR